MTLIMMQSSTENVTEIYTKTDKYGKNLNKIFTFQSKPNKRQR